MRLSAVLAASILLASLAQAATPVGQLQAVTRHGQVFLTWKQNPTPQGTTFNVYRAERPIGDVSQARCLARHIEAHSARDWWEDPASFTKGKKPGEPVGFLLEVGGTRLDPRDGLFVHTPEKGAPAKLYFAVTSTGPDGREERQILPRLNSLEQGVTAAAGELRPIWQRDGEPLAQGAGKGKALWLNLHAKGGVVGNMEYLVFGDASMGWREGLPFKFGVRLENDEVVVRPTDRVWINRPHREAGDGGMPAIWTFWYGYNSKIYDRQEMAHGVPTNYTERRNLWILDWVRDFFQPDPNRWYCSGSSMGGCGTMSFGLRHPELFAALHAHVPIVSYTYRGVKGSATRLEPSCWVGPIGPELKTNEGVSLLARMDSAQFVSQSRDDLPPVFLVHGRRDSSIPWENNPPFYRAMEAARQAFAVYWDDGAHSTCGRDAPADVKAWLNVMRRYRRDQSYPTFTNTSSDRQPGDGRRDDGDTIGWINRGLDWRDIDDAADHYAITLRAEYPDLIYPVRTDVTLRRVQQFRTRPGEALQVRVGDASPHTIRADAQGRVTVQRVEIPSLSGVRVTIRRG